MQARHNQPLGLETRVAEQGEGVRLEQDQPTRARSEREGKFEGDDGAEGMANKIDRPVQLVEGGKHRCRLPCRAASRSGIAGIGPAIAQQVGRNNPPRRCQRRDQGLPLPGAASGAVEQHDRRSVSRVDELHRRDTGKAQGPLSHHEPRAGAGAQRHGWWPARRAHPVQGRIRGGAMPQRPRVGRQPSGSAAGSRVPA